MSEFPNDGSHTDSQGSEQGVFASDYTNWLTKELTENAEAVAYALIVVLDKLDIADKDRIIEALESGAFSLSDLFNAANNKTGVEPDIDAPTPALIFTGDFADLGSIDLSCLFTGDTATFDWSPSRRVKDCPEPA